LSAAIMVTAMNSKSSSMRDALMDGLADVCEQLGAALVNQRRLKGNAAEDFKARMFAIVAATLTLVDPVAKAGVKEEDKHASVQKYHGRIRKQYADRAQEAGEEPQDMLGNELMWAVRETIKLVQNTAFADIETLDIVDVLDPSGASTTTTSTTTTTTTRPSPTPWGRN